MNYYKKINGFPLYSNSGEIKSFYKVKLLAIKGGKKKKKITMVVFHWGLDTVAIHH